MAVSAFHDNCPLWFEYIMDPPRLQHKIRLPYGASATGTGEPLSLFI